MLLEFSLYSEIVEVLILSIYGYFWRIGLLYFKWSLVIKFIVHFCKVNSIEPESWIAFVKILDGFYFLVSEEIWIVAFKVQVFIWCNKLELQVINIFIQISKLIFCLLVYLAVSAVQASLFQLSWFFYILSYLFFFNCLLVIYTIIVTHGSIRLINI